MQKKRCPPWVKGVERERFLKTQAVYDQRLKRAGFVDIESGSDLGDFPALTVPTAPDPGRRTSFVSFEALTAFGDGLVVDEDGNERSIATSDRFEYWHRFAALVDRLPADYPRRGFLGEVAETGVITDPAVLKKYGLRSNAAYAVVRRFCERHGLPRTQTHDVEGARAGAGEGGSGRAGAEPAPARQLVGAEVKRVALEMEPRKMSPEALARLRAGRPRRPARAANSRGRAA